MDLEKNSMQRLVFIKYAYEKALEFSYGPYPMSQMSVLMFHDSIELFLYLSYEIAGGTKKPDNITFLSYWDEIKKKLKKEITQKVSIGKLDRARAGMKHHGILVSESMIEEFRVNAKNFFEENTQNVFDINFEDISLVNLVSYPSVKHFLKEAEKFIPTDTNKANLNVSIAFSNLMEHFRMEEYKEFGVNALSRNTKSASINGVSDNPEIESVLYDISLSIDDIDRNVEDLRNVITLLAVGIDYYNYLKFKRSVPIVSIDNEGRYGTTKTLLPEMDKEKITEEEVQSNINLLLKAQ